MQTGKAPHPLTPHLAHPIQWVQLYTEIKRNLSICMCPLASPESSLIRRAHHPLFASLHKNCIVVLAMALGTQAMQIVGADPAADSAG